MRLLSRQSRFIIHKLKLCDVLLFLQLCTCVFTAGICQTTDKILQNTSYRITAAVAVAEAEVVEAVEAAEAVEEAGEEVWEEAEGEKEAEVAAGKSKLCIVTRVLSLWYDQP